MFDILAQVRNLYTGGNAGIFRFDLWTSPTLCKCEPSATQNYRCRYSLYTLNSKNTGKLSENKESKKKRKRNNYKDRYIIKIDCTRKYNYFNLIVNPLQSLQPT
uniref:Uncharacterized protein n=1 Tax=Cacopsylla melanoneura TaxID=428564 RepID=A0A8D8Y3F1_9HEMI